MLYRKNKYEFAQEVKKKRRILRFPILLFFASQILFFLRYKCGITDGYQTAKYGAQLPITWDEYLSYLPYQVLIGFIVGVGTYVYQYYFKNFYESKYLICNICEKMIKNKGQLDCECGGKFIDLDQVKWKDEDSW